MKYLVSAVDALKGLRLLVVGDAMLDRFVHGEAERLSPEAPVPVFRPDRTVEVLGGAGNVAANLKAFGCAPILICALGRDAAGDRVRQLADFEVRDFAPAAARTTVKERLIAGRQQIVRIDREAPVELGWPELADAVRSAVAQADGLVVSDYGKGVIGEPVAHGLVREAKARGIPIVGDPVAAPVWPYRGFDALTPNVRELELAWGGLPSAGHRALAALGLKHLAVTRGAAGIALFSGGRVREIPAEPAEFCDVAGAGDTVTAMLAACLSAGLDIVTACRLANRAAGLAVRKRGTAVVVSAELKRAAAGDKIVPPQRLREVIERWRETGARIGFTNGVFDLLHPGHLHLLRQAKTLCDRLVVAVNDDSSTARSKPGRPVQDLTARIAVVAALDCVDVATGFSQSQLLELLEACRPDVMVKGGDYAEGDVIGREFAGRVRIVPLLPGHSTTGTLIRARRAA